MLTCGLIWPRFSATRSSPLAHHGHEPRAQALDQRPIDEASDNRNYEQEPDAKARPLLLNVGLQSSNTYAKYFATTPMIATAERQFTRSITTPLQKAGEKALLGAAISSRGFFAAQGVPAAQTAAFLAASNNKALQAELIQQEIQLAINPLPRRALITRHFFLQPKRLWRISDQLHRDRCHHNRAVMLRQMQWQIVGHSSTFDSTICTMVGAREEFWRSYGITRRKFDLRPASLQ